MTRNVTTYGLIVSKTKIGTTTNLKMTGGGITECPEIEQMRRCRFFGTGLCPSCYSEHIYRLRKGGKRWREEQGIHSHRVTPDRDVVRLGTYIEIEPLMWFQYKQGKGTWDCCGQTWTRPDFQTRPYILVTRGLEPTPFYEEVLKDSHLLTLQVSVDITDKTTPDKKRLLWFNAQTKTVFRLKTTLQNTKQFIRLVENIGIEPWRIIEMPLRLVGKPFTYSYKTPLEERGWSLTKFGRCNTPCRYCKTENGLNLCTSPYEARRGFRYELNPPRQTVEPQNIPWRNSVRQCLSEYGGVADLNQVYGWFESKYPWLYNRPGWKFRVRVTIQQVGKNIRRGRWRLA